MSFEPLASRYYGWLIDGWLLTLWLSALVVLVATALGSALALARDSRNRWLSRAAAVYVSAFRNTPLLVQLFFWYFGAATLLPDALRDWLHASHTLRLPAGAVLRWPSFEFLCAIAGLSLYATAYVGEEIRAGLRGVPAAQREAGASLGLSRWQIDRLIVLPQAFAIATPPLLGQYMNVVKNTSLTMAIGVVELSAASRQVEAESFRTFHAFAVATLLYMVTIAALELASRWLQARQRAMRGALR